MATSLGRCLGCNPRKSSSAEDLDGNAQLSQPTGVVRQPVVASESMVPSSKQPISPKKRLANLAQSQVYIYRAPTPDDLWCKAVSEVRALAQQQDLDAIDDLTKQSLTNDDVGSRKGIPALEICERLEQHLGEQSLGRNKKFYDILKKNISVLKQFIGIVDTAVSFDPGHAALPWAAMRLVLVTITATTEFREGIMDGTALIASPLSYCNIYHSLFITSNFGQSPERLAVVEQLEQSICKSYSLIYSFLLFTVRYKDTKITSIMKVPELQDRLVALEAQNRKLLEAADVCQATQISGLELSNDTILSTVLESRDVLMNGFTLAMQKHQDELLSKLQIADGATFQDRLQSGISDPSCHPDTRQGLLSDIYDWARGGSNTAPLFWLCGPAGAGKSTISCSVAQKLSQEEGLLVYSFFFKRGGGEGRDSTRRFITSIASQLAAQNLSLGREICNAIEKDAQLANQPPSKHQYDALIGNPLATLVTTATDVENSSPKMVVVIDAADECLDGGVRPVVDLLADNKVCKIFITSRATFKLFGVKELQNPISAHVYVEMQACTEATIQADIDTYMKAKFTEFRDNFNNDPHNQDILLPTPWPDKEEMEEAVAKSTPLFIVAATVVRFLQSNTTLHPRRRLSHVLQLQGRKGTPLGDIYLHIIKQLDRDESTRDEVLSQFREIAGSLIMLKIPLSIRALSKLLGILEEDAISLLNVLRPVIDVQPSPLPTKLYHLSFRDYLISKEIVAEYRVLPAQVHSGLAEKCLDLLSTGLRENICQLSSFGTQVRDISSAQIDSYLPPEIRYASSYWVYHVISGLDQKGRHLKDEGMEYSFLVTHFLHWLEALSLIRGLSEILGLIDSLIEHVHTEDGVRMMSFLEDARRFVLSTREIASIAPLQLYRSAILFSPLHSVIRKTFLPQVPRWMNKLPPVQAEWNSVLQTFTPHADAVDQVAFLDDRIMASADTIMVLVWDLVAGALLFRFLASSGSSAHRSLIFSKGGKLAATSTWEIEVWDTSNGRHLLTVERDKNLGFDAIQSLIFAEDEQRITYVSADTGSVVTYDWITGKESQIKGPQEIRASRDSGSLDEFHSALSPNGKWLIDCSMGRVRLYEWENFDPTDFKILGENGSEITAIAFSRDSSLFCASFTNGDTWIWDIRLPKIKSKFTSDYSPICWNAVSNDYLVITTHLSSEGSHNMTIWNLLENSKKEVSTSSFVTSLAFSPSGSQLSVGCWDGSIQIWDPVRVATEDSLLKHDSEVETIAFSDSTQNIVSSSSRGRHIKAWEILREDDESRMSIAFQSSLNDETKGEVVRTSKENPYVMRNIYDGWQLWRPTDWKLIGAGSHRRYGIEAFLSQDGRQVLTTPAISSNGGLSIKDSLSGKRVAYLDITKIFSVACFNDTYVAAADSINENIDVWRRDSAEKLQHSFPLRYVCSMQFSRDGKRLKATTSEWSGKIWDISTGKLLGEHMQPDGARMRGADLKLDASFLSSKITLNSQTKLGVGNEKEDKVPDCLRKFSVHSSGRWITKNSELYL